MTGTVMAIDERKQAQGLLQQQFEQQRLVMEVTQRIRRSLNLQDILQTTVDEVRQFLQCDRVTIFQFSPGWGGAVVVESVADEWMLFYHSRFTTLALVKSTSNPLNKA
jgi:light-regulated signal transduction histidine kinase (bacteriophytochrome)